jgi:hypothetical protein
MPVSINGNTGITFPDGSLQTAAASPLVLRNRIINGDMVIDQRNAGASVTVTADNTYTVDRWKARTSQASKFSVQQNAGSVTPPVGFSNYLGVTSLSAYSVVAGDYMFLTQPIEGFNIADLNWGTANAKTITVSFWVRSSLTGTFGGALNNGNNNRSYPFTYTISSANTWTQISVTIAGDTSGTWFTTNAQGIAVDFNLGTGSTYSGTAGSWSGSALFSATGAVSVVGTNGATFYITGVQLEIGTSATPFERRLYNQELANCQRYFWVNPDNYRYFKARESDRFRACTVPFSVIMRATPTITKISDPSGFTWTWDGVANSSVSGGGTAPTDGYTATTGVMQASAEL